MDLEAVADELYRGSPDEFVERRQQRVVEARAAKDRPLVKAITALRRPTRSAWLVNLLARGAADDVAGLLDLGAALADAQRRGAGPDLRRLSRERHTAVEELTRRAVDLGAREGHVATDATRQEVSQTLQAALADPAVAELLRIGRVVQPASYGGFGPMELFAAALPEAPPSSAEPVAEPVAEPDPEPDPVDEEAARSQREADELVRATAETLAAATEQAADADQAASEATRHADELADRVEDLRAQLAEAEAEERAARELARTARKAQQEAQRELSEAEQAAAEARGAVPASTRRQP